MFKNAHIMMSPTIVLAWAQERKSQTPTTYLTADDKIFFAFPNIHWVGQEVMFPLFL